MIPPRIKGQLDRADALFMGFCVVQAPGAWTRIGPTWLVPGVGWITDGLGVRRWGTTEGLAQLAGEKAADAQPEWHARGWSIVPTPNVVYALDDVARKALPGFSEVGEGE